MIWKRRHLGRRSAKQSQLCRLLAQECRSRRKRSQLADPVGSAGQRQSRQTNPICRQAEAEHVSLCEKPPGPVASNKANSPPGRWRAHPILLGATRVGCAKQTQCAGRWLVGTPHPARQDASRARQTNPICRRDDGRRVPPRAVGREPGASNKPNLVPGRRQARASSSGGVGAGRVKQTQFGPPIRGREARRDGAEQSQFQFGPSPTSEPGAPKQSQFQAGGGRPEAGADLPTAYSLRPGCAKQSQSGGRESWKSLEK